MGQYYVVVFLNASGKIECYMKFDRGSKLTKLWDVDCRELIPGYTELVCQFNEA